MLSEVFTLQISESSLEGKWAQEQNKGIRYKSISEEILRPYDLDVS